MGTTVAVAAPLAAFTAWVGARALCARRSSAALDESVGVQKIHVQPTPRIGGIAVAVGLLGGTAAQWAMGIDIETWLLLLVCVSPGLIWGLIEDLTKRGEVFVRLALTGMAAAMAFFLLDARLTFLHVPGLDSLLRITVVSFAMTLIAVTGVSHAINVIDGLNGLAGFTSLVAAAGLAIMGWTVGDTLVASSASVLAASIGGFLLVNFPRGRIFLGDGGAYLVGLLLAELSVLLVHRNSEVSVWFPLVLLAYPVWETLFSMARRRLRGRSPGQADRLHLHSLVYHRMVRAPSRAPAHAVARNSLASLYLWPLPLACFLLALLLGGNTVALQLAAVGFAAAYCALYLRIVRFRMPRWAVVRLPDVRKRSAEVA